jgi:hypothetical protein
MGESSSLLRISSLFRATISTIFMISYLRRWRPTQLFIYQPIIYILDILWQYRSLRRPQAAPAAGLTARITDRGHQRIGSLGVDHLAARIAKSIKNLAQVARLRYDWCKRFSTRKRRSLWIGMARKK